MNVGVQTIAGDQRKLFSATKQFAVESRSRSWWEVIVTLLPMLALLAAASWVGPWPLKLVCSLAGGLLMVRAFILYHDFLHGAILHGSPLGMVVMYGVGALLLTPPRSWRESHNFHHANVGKIGAPGDAAARVVVTDIGAFPLVSVEDWERASKSQRFRYRLARHPITILFAYFTVFMGALCLASFFRNPGKHWPSLLIFGIHLALVGGLWWAGGWATAVFSYLFPLWIASATGALLFYMQHSAPGLRVYRPDEWNVFEAALKAATYLKLGKTMEWITGCIGYHHVHHINSKIPFYKLRAAMTAIPELQHPATVHFRLGDITKCFRANLWNSGEGRLVAYPARGR